MAYTARLVTAGNVYFIYISTAETVFIIVAYTVHLGTAGNVYFIYTSTAETVFIIVVDMVPPRT